MNDLVKHISTINARTIMSVGSNAFILTDSVDHWADMDITTPEQLDHYLAACNHFEIYRSIHGHKPSWAMYDTFTTDEINNLTDKLIANEKANQLLEEQTVARLCNEFGQTEDTLKRWGVI